MARLVPLVTFVLAMQEIAVEDVFDHFDVRADAFRYLGKARAACCTPGSSTTRHRWHAAMTRSMRTASCAPKTNFLRVSALTVLFQRSTSVGVDCSSSADETETGNAELSRSYSPASSTKSRSRSASVGAGPRVRSLLNATGLPVTEGLAAGDPFAATVA